MSNLQGYIIKDAGLVNKPKYEMVCVTQIMDDGQWVIGNLRIVSLRDAVEEAEKAGVPIFFENYLEKG